MGNATQQPKSEPTPTAEKKAASSPVRKPWITKTFGEKMFAPVVSLFVDLPYFLFTLVAYETLLKIEDAEITETSCESKELAEGWEDILEVLSEAKTPGLEDVFSQTHGQHVHEKPNKPRKTLEEPLHSAWRKVPFHYLYDEKKVEKTDTSIHHGKVIWFDRKRGFGFIHPILEDLKKIYVHHSALQGKGYHNYLFKGESVEFQERVDKKGRPKAIKVTGPKGHDLRITKLRKKQHEQKAKKHNSSLEPLPAWHKVPQFCGYPTKGSSSDPKCVIAVHDETH